MPSEDPWSKSLAKAAGGGALLALEGTVRLVSWIWDHTEIGPAEPINDMRPSESPNEYLRRKHNADMGGNYGPHDDLDGPAYVRDRHGNLRRYRP